MSFNEDTSSTRLKNRKTERACDACRRKKIRCDRVSIPGSPCSNCISSSLDCTYLEPAKKLKQYVQRLENRAKCIDKLLRQLCGDDMLYTKIMAFPEGNWTVEDLFADPSFDVRAMRSLPNTGNIAIATASIRSVMKDNPEITRSADDEGPLDNSKRLEIEREGQFFGESSGEALLRTAMKQKDEYVSNENEYGDANKPAMKTRRPEFWTLRPWEQAYDVIVPMQYTFPDINLALHCIDLYFKCSNLYLPLLHRPTFDKYVKEGLYLTDGGFARVFLLVCAVGAQHSDNPRVRLEGVDSDHSAGWKWFEQVEITRRSLFTPATLYDLQLYCLYLQYLQGSFPAELYWPLVGVGIRLAQDVGAHRRKPHDHKLTIDEELWKRAFWVLVCMDKIISSSLGRSCIIQDEEIDLDLPVDCDDEYWDNPDPEKCFKQPPNTPSLITYFILYLKLQAILTSSQRTIYTIDKSQMLSGFVGQQWEQCIVAELHSVLNEWVDLVPDHLRWDPKREDDNFFNQSASLYAAYYNVQISIHRTFISSSSKPSSLPFPSLDICAAAASSCSHVLYIQRKRNDYPPPQIQIPVFTAGIVLLLIMSSAKRSGLPMDPNKELADLQNCMAVLKSLEVQWHDAGVLWGILYDFASTVQLPLSQSSMPSETKEVGNSNALRSSTSVSEPPFDLRSQNQVARTVGDLRRVQRPRCIPQTQRARQSEKHSPHWQQYQHQYQHSQQEPLPLRTHPSPLQSQSLSELRPGTGSQQYNSSISPSIHAEPPISFLPLYSNEPGRPPLHGQVLSAQKYPSQPQTQPPYLYPQTNYRYSISSSAITEGSEQCEPSLHVGPHSSYELRYPPAPQQQQRHHPHRHHELQNTPTAGISSIPAMMPTQGAYGAAMATGMMFDAFSQWSVDSSSEFSSMGMGPISIPPPSSSSSSSLMENVFRGSDMIPAPVRSGEYSDHQQQKLPQQEAQQALTDLFVLGKDEVAISSNAHAGFDLDGWAYPTNVSELRQGNIFHSLLYEVNPDSHLFEHESQF